MLVVEELNELLFVDWIVEAAGVVVVGWRGELERRGGEERWRGEVESRNGEARWRGEMLLAGRLNVE